MNHYATKENFEMLKSVFSGVQKKVLNIEISLDGIVGWALSKQWWNAPYKIESEEV